MRDESTRQSVVFNDLFGKQVVALLDQPQASSDGGAVLLKACDTRLGLIDRLSACLRDDRQAGKIQHTLSDLIRQRMFGIACGYADCNDAARLVGDPVQKNVRRPKALYRMGLALAETVIERQRRRLRGKAKRITIELDPTDDPTHGAQRLSLFNGHYDTWCYLPVAGFVQFDDEAEQYLLTYVGESTSDAGCYWDSLAADGAAAQGVSQGTAVCASGRGLCLP